jgi:hypothetical protein
MKNKMVSILVLALLSLWIPNAKAEISEDLDPMLSPDPQAIVMEETSIDKAATDQASNVVSTADATDSEKKVEGTKKEKSKKSSKKKSSENKDKSKKKKASTKSSKKHSKSSN